MKAHQMKKTQVSSMVAEIFGAQSQLTGKLLSGVFLLSLASTSFADQKIDTDTDGVPDHVEMAEQTDPNNPTNFLDSDGDTIPDFLDADSDGDHVSDMNELGGNPYMDSDNDGVPAYLDDNDNNASVGNADGRVHSMFDPDNNNTAAFQDSTHDHRVDSDGDKVPDSTEMAEGSSPYDANSFVDSDGDRIPDIIDFDSDADGIWNQLESGSLPYYDRDCDGVPAYLDDNDFDWAVGNNDNRVQSMFDPDADGVASFQNPNNKIEDTDGDGVFDSIETAQNTNPEDALEFLDTDNDSVPDILDLDDDNDLILDVIEGDGDMDNDSIPNNQDTDSDGDGVSDLIEGINDANGDFIPNFVDPTTQTPTVSLDQDNDGLSDQLEGTVDTDSDGTADLADLDSDSDTIPDAEENSSDIDGDGIANFRDTDSDGDGIADIDEGTDDSDGDQFGNYIDLDSDGDSIPDNIELTLDADGDSLPNFLDDDSDGDGIDDLTETGFDSDGDGIADFLDDDSDGDGIPDSTELTVDTDEDGVVAYLDLDDNDATVGRPVVGNPRVIVGRGGGCSIASNSATRDPLLLMTVLACVAGMVRRRKKA